MSDKDEVAKRLADKHYDIEPGITQIFKLRDKPELESLSSEQIKFTPSGRYFQQSRYNRGFVWKISVELSRSTRIFLQARRSMIPMRRVCLILYNMRFQPICCINPRFPRGRDRQNRTILRNRPRMASDGFGNGNLGTPLRSPPWFVMWRRYRCGRQPVDSEDSGDPRYRAPHDHFVEGVPPVVEMGETPPDIFTPRRVGIQSFALRPTEERSTLSGDTPRRGCKVVADLR